MEGEVASFLIRSFFLLLAVVFFIQAFRSFPLTNYGDSDMRLWKSIFYILVAIFSLLLEIGITNL